MRTRSMHYRNTRNQRGYAYLLVMFMLAMLIVGTMAVVPNVLIEGKREREREMIWRGEQYKRAIRLYVTHRTNAAHRLPTSLDVLVKGVPGVHFLRQAYKDPMNAKDGSWRLIYVGPSGQLIGSTRPHTANFLMPGGVPSNGAALAPNQQTTANSNGPLSMSSSFSSPSSSSFNSASSASSSQQKPADATSSDSTAVGDADKVPEVPPDGVTLVGGNIIGVGSKVNQKSVVWYEKAKNYRQFEFIWDPAKDAATAAQQGIGATLPGQPGTDQNGSKPGGPGGSPNPNPSGNPPPQPPPQQ